MIELPKEKSQIVRKEKQVEYTDASKIMNRNCRIYENLCKSNQTKFCSKFEKHCVKDKSNNLELIIIKDFPKKILNNKIRITKRQIPELNKNPQIKSKEISKNLNLFSSKRQNSKKRNTVIN